MREAPHVWRIRAAKQSTVIPYISELSKIRAIASWGNKADEMIRGKKTPLTGEEMNKELCLGLASKGLQRFQMITMLFLDTQWS